MLENMLIAQTKHLSKRLRIKTRSMWRFFVSYPDLFLGTVRKSMRRQSHIHTWPDEHMADCFCSCEVGEGASLITSASNGPAESARGSLTMLEGGPLSLWHRPV